MPNTKIFRGEEDYAADTYTVQTACVKCKEVTTSKLEGPALFRYNQGAFVQDAFPMLSASERELHFMTGICEKCYDDMFSLPEED